MARRAELTKSLAAAAVELEKLKQNDPKEIANLEKELEFVKNGANRWTDNIFSCKDYLVKKRGMMKKEGELLSVIGLRMGGITFLLQQLTSSLFSWCTTQRTSIWGLLIILTVSI